MAVKGSYKGYLDYKFKKYVTVTEYTFILFPRKCHSTNKWLWLKFAYKQTAMYTFLPGGAMFEYRYYDRDQFLMKKIAGEL